MASTIPYRGLPERERPRTLGRGMTQLSLVEHALCPLDSDASLRPNLVHATEYFFSDRQGQRLKATARVVCPAGLSAYDEFYLWALLALTFSQPEPAVEFTATPHYCLRQLGLIDETLRRGGKTYQLFRTAIERLSAVTYQNNAFYDPVRGEHCEVSFGFFSYRLPLGSNSSRAWRFYWDPLFFEVCQATGSALSFNLDIYRQLDTASRRLYLLLKKMFWRRDVLMPFDLRHLAVNVMGFSATQDTRRLKAKLTRCIERLVEHGILALPPDAAIKSLFRKRRTGQCSVVFHRGPHFDRTSQPVPRDLLDSPHYELLATIGFEPPAIVRILRSYAPKLVAEWADITLAAKERNGEEFFKNSPPAYFLDNIRHAATGQRTPPDWWRELRRQEERQRWCRMPTDDQDSEAALDRYLETEARDAFQRVIDHIFDDLTAAGTQETEARDRARQIARANLKAQFYREHPECRPAEPQVAAPAKDQADE